MANFNDYMQEVLQRPRYDTLTGRRPNIGEIIWDAVYRFLEWLFGLLGDILPAQPSQQAVEVFTVIFIIVAGALVILALSGLIYMIFTKRRRKKAVKNELSGWFDDIGHKRLKRGELLAKARACLQVGDMQNAVRHRYLAMLILLNDRKLIKVDKFKTNAQFSEEIAQNAPRLDALFARLIAVFHEAWFGRKAIDMERYLEFDEMDNKILNERNS